MLNFSGPNGGEGIRIFYDGQKVTSDTSKTAQSRSAGDGRIVVGRINTDKDDRYSSVQIDELIYFNITLADTEVKSIYNSA